MSGVVTSKKPVVESTEFTSKIMGLKRLEDATIYVDVIGITPVIPHKWSEKSIRMMEEKHQQVGKVATRANREPKDPTADAEACLYKFEDGRIGLPAVAFKCAMVEACSFFQGVFKTDARRILFVEGEGPDQLVELVGEKHFRVDTPRNSTGVPDIRYRYSFWPWSVRLTIKFPSGVISAESVLALLDAAGRNGVCDWRPGSPKSNSGTFGRFAIGADGALA